MKEMVRSYRKSGPFFGPAVLRRPVPKPKKSSKTSLKLEKISSKPVKPENPVRLRPS